MVGAVDRGAIDFDTAVRLTRAVGQTMARLADWEVATLVGPRRAARGRRRRPPAAGSAARCGSSEEVGGALRAAAGLLLAPPPRRRGRPGRGARRRRRRPATTAVTVGFADLVRFTALSNELDEDRIGDLVEIFESRCADVVAAQRGRVIKTLGDSVLFVAEDPSRAMDIAAGIIDVIGRDTRLPDVRIGLATGSVVMRLGDVFGPPVNMAARLTGVARRNRVIADAGDGRPAAPGPVRHPAAAGPAGARVRARRAGRRTPALSGAGRRPAPFGRRTPGLTSPA